MRYVFTTITILRSQTFRQVELRSMSTCFASDIDREAVHITYSLRLLVRFATVI